MKKYILFFVKLFLPMLFIFSLSIAISTSIGMIQSEANAENTVKEQLESTVTITENIEKMDRDYNNNQIIDVFAPDLKTIKKIGELKEVKYYDYSIPSFIEIDNMSFVNLSNEKYVPPLVRLVGVSKPEMTDIKLNKIHLTEGRLLSSEEIEQGKYTTIISNEFAKLNNIYIGDTFTSNIIIRSKVDPKITTETSINLKVTGMFEDKLYQNSKEKDKIPSLKIRSDILNNFYVPNQVAKDILIQQEKIALETFPTDYANLTDASGNTVTGEQFLKQIIAEEYYEPVYLLSSDQEFKSFEKKALDLLSDFEYFKLLYNKDKYDYLMVNLSYLPSLFRIIWIVCFIVSICCLTLVFLKLQKSKLIKYKPVLVLSLLLAVFSGGLFVGHEVSYILPYEIIYPDTRIDGEEKEHSEAHHIDEGADHSDHIEEDWDDYPYKRLDPELISLREITRAYTMNINNNYLLKYFLTCILSVGGSLFISNIITKNFQTND